MPIFSVFELITNPNMISIVLLNPINVRPEHLSAKLSMSKTTLPISSNKYRFPKQLKKKTLQVIVWIIGITTVGYVIR